ncbi:MAG: lactate dehydrogenase [Rhodospirillaceae bacterium]|jgi:phosphoglycerate dehydrogenase-like enzyme|nr:lactate dehydrogenase [Rhodospirillaceae bacterium]MBT4042310.1 lactate dehydrogenase [Rhodospirillaceae bacterium]MBT4689784.1 lactate dehydrogenase [Rhodospirillaceae bacterium]MBT5081246.1 lactate dehydrogenase [Rhodospirillaceae bacterium]MBT5522622.1 lactate dehydrogenase [Rhodospirillaceae bacterium]
MAANKILFVSQFPAAIDFAHELVPAGFELLVADAPSAAYSKALADADFLVGFVDMLVDGDLYAGGPNLKLIQLLSAGYDRADIPAAQKAGVPISNNGGANSVAVSEHALMLMLAVSRQLVRQHTTVAAGNWRGNDIPVLHELRNKTLGIIGLGTIGKKTARLALAFGMDVIYYDVARLTEAEEDALGVRFRLQREIFAESDLISLHVPFNASTDKMIGATEFAQMKPTAMLVNTARGQVVDEGALFNALTSGTIAAAGLDVFDEEPPSPDNPLLGLDNVILTAHMAGPTFESNKVRVRNAFDNVQRVSRGEAPLWVIPELEE